MRICRTILALLIVVIPGATSAQECSEALPKVIQHGEPSYPPIARTAHVTGEVRLKITTDGESVSTVETEEGPPLLRKASEDNAKTWKFVPHKPGCFHVRFQYRISSDGVDVEFLKSAGVIELNAPAPKMTIDYAHISLGTWKVQLESAHGKASLLLELYYTGPTGEWLDFRIVGGNQDREEHGSEDVDFGHKEGDLLALYLKINQPDQKQIKTFLIGKMEGNNIVGTFVDDDGVTGKWTAVKVPD
jgi:Gram-negative bacterial TonB protein C-terminal